MSNKPMYKHRTFVCKGCTKSVTARRDSGKTSYCSLKCYRASKRPERKTGTMRACEVCSKEAYKPKSQAKALAFCSTACHDNYQGRAKIAFNCKTCGDEFKWSPSRTKQKYSPKFCSIACRNADPEWREATTKANLAQHRAKGPNKLERAGYEILSNLRLGFTPQADIDGKFLVDARIGSVVIQWDGEYWHGHPSKIRGAPDKRQAMRMKLDKSQDAYMKKRGLKVLRFWETDVYKNKDVVIETIRCAVRGIA